MRPLQPWHGYPAAVAEAARIYIAEIRAHLADASDGASCPDNVFYADGLLGIAKSKAGMTAPKSDEL